MFYTHTTFHFIPLRPLTLRTNLHDNPSAIMSSQQQQPIVTFVTEAVLFDMVSSHLLSPLA